MAKHPDHIRHEDFLEAIGPLLEMCGTSPMEVFPDVKISGVDDSGATLQIEFVSAVDPEDGTEPITVGDVPEYAEYGWPVTIFVS